MSRKVDSDKIWIPVVLGFLLLAVSFAADWWNFPYAVGEVTPIDSTFAETTTVRMSAAELVRTGGDASMLDCYSCHEPDEPPELGYDENGELIWEEHRFDFDLRHGANHRNEFCYTCHVKEDLEKLRTPDGRILDITEGNLLCGSCHGTMFRDWEVGDHGRITGYWDADLGPQKREDCTSCHNAHTPAFPSLKPWAAPQPLRPSAVAEDSVGTAQDSIETQ